MFKNNSNSMKKEVKEVYRISDVSNSESEAKKEIIQKLDKEAQKISEKIHDDMIEFHEKMIKKYGENYRGTNIMCSVVINSGKGIRTLANANFADYTLKSQKEVKKVIESLAFIAEKVGEKIQAQADIDFKQSEEDINMEKAHKIADGVIGIVNFSKEFFGEKVYIKMSKKGYLDPYGMIDFNNKKAFDFVKKLLDKKSAYEREEFWDTLKSKFKEVMSIDV
jgi:hypothetical protein|nr:MAG TPA: hypothetical protein [Caudoviricetes sp.]